MSAWLRLTVGMIVLLVNAEGVWAQSATIEGRLVDEQGGALVGATVTLSAPSLAAPIVFTTGVDGTYRIASLPAGSYTVSFTLSGFETQRYDDVTVQDGERRTLSVQLGVAPFTQRVDVVAVSPLLGVGIGLERVPASVSVFDAAELTSRGAVSLSDALNERLGAVSLEGTTTNPYQPTLRFRGFTASPLLGLPQGIAVYQNGVRVNEPFGDTVQFDLMPQFAIDRIQLSAGAEPTYGLNALGGALALRLKNGFENRGFRGELSGGSFERITATADYGASRGPWALYAGATRFDENGWRSASPSQVTQVIADVGYREGAVDAGVTMTFADTSLNGNGPAPVELLEVDRSAVFTYPDTTDNRLAMWQGRFNVIASSVWSVQTTGYYRDLDRRTLNGDEADFAVCDDAVLPPGAPTNTLCFGTGDDNAAAANPVVDVRTGRFITDDDAGGDAAVNRTTTASKGYGAAFQATANSKGGERDNALVIGVSADLSDVAFASNSEVGTLTFDRGVSGSGLLAGIFGQAPDDIFSTDIDTDNRAFGLYFSDTLSISDRVHLTVSGRYNDVRIDIIDNLGTSLNGRHAFSRFNPGVGAVFDVNATSAVFGRYSESNRAPTAAELSCADPAEPCRVPNAFLSDPPLEQAVARAVEAGARGRWAGGALDIDWSVTAYRTRIRDDILFVASTEFIGTGFFQNAGDTQRVGLDLELNGSVRQLGWFTSYALVEATFESPLRLPGSSAANDATNEHGEVEVEAGDRLPGIPRHSFKAGVRYDLTNAWGLAIESVVSSSRVFLGDEGNDQPPLPGYGLVNLRSSYAVTDHVELFARVDNLFDKTYATVGVLAELELQLDEVPNASDPRFVAPGAPRSAFAGVRVRF